MKITLLKIAAVGWLLLFFLVIAQSVAQAGEYRYSGSFDDPFRYSYQQRSDLYSHAATTGGCTVVAGYGLEAIGTKYHDGAAAGGCFAAVTAKEFLKDSWMDRGDIAANAIGALLGYGLKKALPATPLRIDIVNRRLVWEVKF